MFSWLYVLYFLVVEIADDIEDYLKVLNKVQGIALPSVDTIL